MLNNRAIPLEGANNLRDLGGVSTTDGREVRRGKLFRADSLHRLTDNDLTTLQPLGITTVLDLRSDREIEQTGTARLLEIGARYVHLPVLDSNPAQPAPTDVPPTLGELYMLMANHFAPTFVAAISSMAQHDMLPSVFHCAVGKDRTGITAAVVYSILGVDRETIIEDYVLTDIAMQKVIAQMAADPNADKIPEGYLRAEAETITTFLQSLDELYGSPVEWIVRSGVSENALADLRSIMVE